MTKPSTRRTSTASGRRLSSRSRSSITPSAARLGPSSVSKSRFSSSSSSATKGETATTSGTKKRSRLSVGGPSNNEGKSSSPNPKKANNCGTPTKTTTPSLPIIASIDEEKVLDDKRGRGSHSSPPQRATPYWKVTSEGRMSSPRLTRSAKKKSLRVVEEVEGGTVLTFSPPDRSVQKSYGSDSVLTGTEGDLDRYLVRIKSLEEANCDLLSKLKITNDNKLELEHSFDESMTKMKEDLEERSSRLTLEEETNSALLEKILSIEEENETLKEENKNLTFKLQTALGDVDDMGLKLKKEKETLQKMEAKTIIGKSDAKSKECELIRAKSEIEGKDEEVEKLKEELRLAESKIIEVQDENKRICEQLSTTRFNLEEKITHLEKENITLSGQLSNAKSTVEKTTEEKNVVEAQLLQTASSLSRATKWYSAEKEKVHNLEKRVQSDVRVVACDEKVRRLDAIRAELQNQVIRLSGNIRVFVRVRPVIEGEKIVSSLNGVPKKHALKANGRQSLPFSKHSLSSSSSSSRQSLSLTERPPQESPFNFPSVFDHRDLTKHVIEAKEPYKDRGGLNPRQKTWKFGFDRVFSPDHGQDDVWNATEPLVQSAIDGHNVCVFAYGQSGSGKTHTMFGDGGGMVFRSVDAFFQAKRETESLHPGSSVEISVELCEIYNEKVRDLRASLSNDGKRTSISNDGNRDRGGDGAHPPLDENDVLEIISVAQKRRHVKATKSNSESSRSHMLFTIRYAVRNPRHECLNRTGKLHICDLAGSERLHKSGSHTINEAGLLKETQHINTSLSALSNVIEKLQSNNPHVPYRDSKLTYLLQDSLGGDSKTLAIVCCSPQENDFNESICSLRFAAKVSKVELKSMGNFKC